MNRATERERARQSRGRAARAAHGTHDQLAGAVRRKGPMRPRRGCIDRPHRLQGSVGAGAESQGHFVCMGSSLGTLNNRFITLTLAKTSRGSITFALLSLIASGKKKKSTASQLFIRRRRAQIKTKQSAIRGDAIIEALE